LGKMNGLEILFFVSWICTRHNPLWRSVHCDMRVYIHWAWCCCLIVMMISPVVVLDMCSPIPFGRLMGQWAGTHFICLNLSNYNYFPFTVNSGAICSYSVSFWLAKWPLLHLKHRIYTRSCFEAQ
jgi:hypothetical protein